MKLVLGCDEGLIHHHLLEGCVPDLEITKPFGRLDLAGQVEAIRDADAFFGYPFRDLILAGEKLRWVQTAGAGVDYAIAIPELVERDILLANTSGAHSPSLAEHVFALMLSMTRRVPDMARWQPGHYWGKNEVLRTLTEIYQKKIGIIGFGSIGRAIAQRAQGFEMEIVALDAQAVDGSPYVTEVLTPNRLDELLDVCDVVVVTVPLTPDTLGMLGTEQFASMKSSAYLIHMSRGGIVNEGELAQALHDGLIAGAAFDVYATEPLPESSPLWDAPNFLLSPHIASDSAEKERRCIDILRENIIRFTDGQPLRNQVDKQRGY